MKQKLAYLGKGLQKEVIEESVNQVPSSLHVPTGMNKPFFSLSLNFEFLKLQMRVALPG